MVKRGLLLLTCASLSVGSDKDGRFSDVGKNAGVGFSKNLTDQPVNQSYQDVLGSIAQKGIKTFSEEGAPVFAQKGLQDLSKGVEKIGDSVEKMAPTFGRDFGLSAAEKAGEAANKIQAVANSTKSAGVIGLAVAGSAYVAHEYYDRNYPESQTRLARFKADRERESIETSDDVMDQYQRCFARFPRLARNEWGVPAHCMRFARQLFALGRKQEVLQVVDAYKSFDTETIYSASPEQAQKEYEQCLADSTLVTKLLRDDKSCPFGIPKRCKKQMCNCAILSPLRFIETSMKYLQRTYPDHRFKHGTTDVGNPYETPYVNRKKYTEESGVIIANFNIKVE